MGITSVICRPAAGATVAAGSVAVQGYAIAGGERTVARVELSADGGATWKEATLLDEPRPFVWSLWEAQIDLPVGRHQLVVRATDSAGRQQPASVREVWNFKGYMNNAWHRVDIQVE
jgi:sulfite oxidase